MSARLRVLQAGACTSVQDHGRPGWQALGVPAAGALDPLARRLANRLVGNREDEAVLEVLLAGPTLEVLADSVRIAIAGTAQAAERLDADGVAQALVPDRSHTLYQGERLRLGALGDSRTACIAVAGGFDLAPVLGSVATYARAGLGGLHGAPLASGDELPLRLASAPAGMDRACRRPPDRALPSRIRLVTGPHADWFTDAALATLFAAEWTVTREADRMGMRLEGPALPRRQARELLPEGIATGSVQVPHGGQPVVLLADRQTTGGYPKIATVISADLPALARALPGSVLRFAEVDVATAEAARRAQEREFLALLDALVPVTDPAGLDLASLYSENLVSGVTDGEPEPPAR